MNEQTPDAAQLLTVVTKAEELGTQALLDGDMESARSVFSELLNLMPDNAIGLFGIGTVAKADGDLARAEQFYREAARLAPDWAVPNRELGALLFAQGRSNRAGKYLEKALQAEPGDIEGRYMLASAYQQSGRNADFERHLYALLSHAPDHMNANNDLGCLLVSKGDVEAGERHLRTAASSSDATPSTLVNFALLLLMKDEVAEASDVFAQALDADPNNVSALVGAATAARRTGDLSKALGLAKKASTLAARDANTLNLVGTILREINDLAGAEEQFQAALRAAPSAASPRANLGLLQLLKGEWHDGWANFRSRLGDPGNRLPWGGVTSQGWTGGDLSGKAVMVLSEQGFGDTIQFARYLPALADKGAKIYAAVQPEVRSLIAGIDDRIEFVRPNDSVPPSDLQVMLLDVPMYLGIDAPCDVDGAPYLTAPAAAGPLAEIIADLDGLKVGVNWRGNPGHKEDFKRSIPIADFSRLLGVDNVTYVSLCVGGAEAAPDGVVDPTAHLRDFADTASLVDALDLVITVDTATAHLAGALGKTCWTLLPLVPDWRWQLTGDATVWYDSMTLFRQTSLNEWDDVLARVRAALEEKAAV